MKRLAGPTLILLLLAACGGPADGPSVSGAAVVDIPYTKYVLDNGLRLIVHEDRKAPIVAVNVWYDVGAGDEKPGNLLTATPPPTFTPPPSSG